MKTLTIYLLVGISAIVAQTTILMLPLFHNVFFDLIIPLVVFLVLGFPIRRGVSVAVGLGLLMDLLSGGVFGLYTTTYFWICLSIQGLSKYFDVHDKRFQALLIGGCVLGQHLIFFWFGFKGVEPPASRALPAAMQTIFAAIAGPGIVALLERLRVWFEELLMRGGGRKDGVGGVAKWPTDI